MTGAALTADVGTRGTGTFVTRAIGIAALLVTAWVVISAFFITPADVQQGDSVRIMYAHVPAAWIAYLAFITTAVASSVSLARRHRTLGFDRVAGASAEVGVLFMGLALVTGSLWGRLTWGTFWQWDPRLTTTLFLFVTYVGYLAVRNIDTDPRRRAKRSAVLALLAVLEIPLVHFSVVLWRSLHQEASVLNTDGDVRLDDMMLFTLFSGVVAFTLIFVWLVMHRQRLATLRDLEQGVGLDAAIAARRGESAATVGSSNTPSSRGA
ncbi:MAG: cytochrome c-type biosis protein CcmC [Actinomycetota bacterium]